VNLNGIKGWSVATKVAAFAGVVYVLTGMVKPAAERAINLSDHTLKDLADMGHPYSAAHGFQIHEPDELVHAQSGEYLHGIEVTPPVGLPGAIIEGSLENTDPKDRWIQEGTLKMRPRPWMEAIVRLFGADWGAMLQAKILDVFNREAGSISA